MSTMELTVGDPYEELTRLHLACANAYTSGQLRVGLEMGAEGVKLARRLGDKLWLRRMQVAIGILQSDAHNLPAAFECFEEALDLCEEIGEPHIFWATWHNLGGALLNAELTDLAFSTADVAIGYANRVESREIAVHCLSSTFSNIANLCLATQQYGRGIRLARQASSMASAPQIEVTEEATATNRAHLLWTLGRLLLRVGFTKEAEISTIEIERLVNARTSTKNIRTTWIAKVMRGTMNVYTGKMNEGLTQLKTALADAERMSPELVADALREMAQAYRVIGQQEHASNCLHELSAHLKGARGEDALFHHRRHIESLASRFIERNDASHNLTTQIRSNAKSRLRHDWHIRNRFEVLENLSTVAELHDDPGGKHPYRVAELSANLARYIALSHEMCEQILFAARLHDLGKIGIPAEILRKPGPLDNSELQIVREHAATGAELLASAHDLDCREVAIAIARHHHEWWSGAGYPDGLAGESIPIAARIVALAEVFDALTHDRPYRPRLSVDRALKLITERAAYQFDPSLVSPFCSMIRELRRNFGELDPQFERSTEQSTFLNAKLRLTERLRRLSN